MTEEQFEGNRLIVEFMGYKLVTPEMRKNPLEWKYSYWENPEFKGSSKGVLGSEKHLYYHSSWDWLIPVCHKIDNLDTKGLADDKYYRYVDFCDSMDEAITFYEKEPVYEIVVEFIKWYNSCQK